MNQDELQKLDSLLEKEEKNLINQLNQIANPNPKAKGDFTVRVPNYGDEDDENAREITDLDRNFAMERELEDKLNAVRKARERIKNGIYQKCENCGDDISTERLEAVPETSKCAKCIG